MYSVHESETTKKLFEIGHTCQPSSKCFAQRFQIVPNSSCSHWTPEKVLKKVMVSNLWTDNTSYRVQILWLDEDEDGIASTTVNAWSLCLLGPCTPKWSSGTRLQWGNEVFVVGSSHSGPARRNDNSTRWRWMWQKQLYLLPEVMVLPNDSAAVSIIPCASCLAIGVSDVHIAPICLALEDFVLMWKHACGLWHYCIPAKVRLHD